MTAPHPVDPLAVDATLHLMADQLVLDLAGDRLPASLLHVPLPDPDGPAVGFLPLEGRHPSDLLVGFTAPDDWYALGMAASGTAHQLDGRERPERTRRVHVVTLLSRSGEHVHRIQYDGEPRPVADLDAEQPIGEQVDLLRLALGMGTPPPPCGSAPYFAAEWLSTVVGSDACDLRTWDDICRLHPAMEVLARGSRHRDEDFVDIADSFSRVCSWSRLRALTAAERFSAPGLIAADGMWFDDGAFARYLLSRCPPLSMLRRAARHHLGSPLADRLDDALAMLGVPEATWPEVTSANGTG